MPEIADVLERESRSVDLEHGDFERLLGRRERKERNRRIRAGAVGVLVVLVTGLVLFRSLTSDEVPATPPVEPAPPVLSGALAYELDGEIYVADPDGSNAVAISDVIDDGCPGDVQMGLQSWSPDGRYLAFRRSADCGDPTTRPDSVIADLQGNVVGTFPAHGVIAWSPDSTRVAVWDEYSYDEGGMGTIGIYGIDGTRETQIAIPPGYEPSLQRGPIWAPDGASLIVSELEVPLDGGTPREVPFLRMYMDRSGAYWTGGLAYSPDGSQVAYGTPDGLMVARADGSDPRVVSDDGAHTAAWSPTGELIAVASNGDDAGNFANPDNYNGRSITEQFPNRLRVVDVQTGSTTVLFEGEPRTWLFVIGFSPDGDRIIYGEHRGVEGQDGTFLDSIWSIAIDGSDARQIVVGTYSGDLRPA
jgi:Tol biopolymer transport system component